MAALAPFKAHTSSGPVQDPQPLPYLQDDDYFSYAINLAVSVQVSQAATTYACITTRMCTPQPLLSVCVPCNSVGSVHCCVLAQ
jgi:hypothetical protein